MCGKNVTAGLQVPLDFTGPQRAIYSKEKYEITRIIMQSCRRRNIIIILVVHVSHKNRTRLHWQTKNYITMTT